MQLPRPAAPQAPSHAALPVPAVSVAVVEPELRLPAREFTGQGIEALECRGQGGAILLPDGRFQERKEQHAFHFVLLGSAPQQPLQQGVVAGRDQSGGTPYRRGTAPRTAEPEAVHRQLAPFFAGLVERQLEEEHLHLVHQLAPAGRFGPFRHGLFQHTSHGLFQWREAGSGLPVQGQEPALPGQRVQHHALAGEVGVESPDIPLRLLGGNRALGQGEEQQPVTIGMEMDRVGVHHPARRRLALEAQPAEGRSGAGAGRHLEEVEEGFGVAGGTVPGVGARQQAIECRRFRRRITGLRPGMPQRRNDQVQHATGLSARITSPDWHQCSAARTTESK